MPNSIVGGISAFGLSGAIIGPMLVCMLMIASNTLDILLVSKTVRSSSSPSTKPKQQKRKRVPSGYYPPHRS